MTRQLLMDKYLVTDGTGGVKEMQSQDELRSWISSSENPEQIRIWIYNSNEWVTYSSFRKQFPGFSVNDLSKDSLPEEKLLARPVKQKHGLKKFLLAAVSVATILLVYNFTRIKWQKAAALSIMAERPANVPVMDIDSLLNYLEIVRGQKLDRITRTNVRIRNSWPDLIQLQLTSNRDTSNAGTRFSGIEFSIDNSTGYKLDKAIVKLVCWKNHEVNKEDTFHLNNISYAAAMKRKVKGSYRGDSLTVLFQSITGKAFNFCYSADKQSNYGNNNDRWFCRE
ncbi:MAG TPA: hypothetical protein VLJ68_14135 [Chitinophagaceae bacterium]|nr:hypothetical protein [Chitinophagaceae bacterium]